MRKLFSLSGRKAKKLRWSRLSALVLVLAITGCQAIRAEKAEDYSESRKAEENKPAEYDGWTLEHLQSCIEANPKDATYYIIRGHLRQLRNERDEAIADYTNGINLAPDKGESYSARSEMYLLMADYDKAMADADKAVDLMPRATGAYDQRARLKMVMQNYTGAIDDVKKSLRFDSRNVRVISTAISCLDALGKYSEGLGAADFIVEEGAQKWPGQLFYSYQDRALLLIHAGQFDAAAKDLDRGIKLNSGHSQLWAYMAVLEAARGNMPAATAAMEKTMSLDTFEPRANRLKGEMYRAGGEWREAVKCYDVSTHLEPEYGPGHMQKAIAEIALGKFGPAKQDLEQATKILPTSALSFSYLALAEAQLGLGTESKEHMQKALALTPDLPANLANQATIDFIGGNLDAALQNCQKALSIDPYQADACAVAASVLQAGGLSEEAKKFDGRARKLGWKPPAVPLAMKGAATSKIKTAFALPEDKPPVPKAPAWLKVDAPP